MKHSKLRPSALAGLFRVLSVFAAAAPLCAQAQGLSAQAQNPSARAQDVEPVSEHGAVLLSGFDLPVPREANPTYEPGDPDPIRGLPNLFLRRKVTASGHWSDRVPEFAVDGKGEEKNAHWAAEKTPVWLTVDLEAPRAINCIHLRTWWNGKRCYGYLIEGSLDGEEWTILIDRRENERRAAPSGDRFLFPSQEVRYVRTTVTRNSESDQAGGHVVEIEGYCVDPETVEGMLDRVDGWNRCPQGFHGGLGSLDVRYRRDAVPEVEGSTRWSGTAWQGERLNAQLVLWSAAPVEQVRLSVSELRTGRGVSLGPDRATARFVRYVLADDVLCPDVLDTAERLDLPPRSTRPVWVTVDVPQDALPGVYRGELSVASRRHAPLFFDLEVEVLPLVLPEPGAWSFHLDLWQNPYAVARYHHVEPWSEEHFLLLEPHLRMLAEAGQKCLTTTILHQPWGLQTFDPYDAMVECVREPDGFFRLDFTVFDRYVEFGASCGLDRWINCYSMVPWTNRVRYFDAATENFETLSIVAGGEEADAFWRDALLQLVDHLREKGWLGRVAIAMDERPFHMLRPTIDLVREVAPDLRIAQAGSNESRVKDDIHDWCVYITPPLDTTVARERAERDLQTTFYVCCVPPRPNTFTFSPPAESAWLGLYAAARHYTGFLRWAYDSWVEDPLRDTKHVTWPAGDCFLVYPNARSSIRFERLREGIQDYEKIRILRGMVSASDDGAMKVGLETLEAALARFSHDAVQRTPAAEFVNEAKAALEDLSRIVANRNAAK